MNDDATTYKGILMSLVIMSDSNEYVKMHFALKILKS